MEAPGSLSSRFLGDIGAGRFLFVDIRDPKKPEKDYTALGFSSPVLSLGPVDQGGLFREISNPLGYGAGSAVFQEDTRLSLRIGMDRSSRQGLWASVPGGLFGIGGYVQNGEDLHAAASFSAGSRGGPQISALAMASNPEAGRIPDDWFPSKPIYPGGSLFHLAGRSLAPLGSLTGGETFLGISWGLSRGSLVPAAAFVHLHGIHRSPLVEAGLMAGACSPGYLTPAGAYPSERHAAALMAKIFPKGPLTLRLRLRVQEGRAESLPTRCSSQKQDLEGGLDLRGKKIRASLEGGGTQDLSTRGRLSQKNLARASAAYRGKKLWLDGSLKGEWTDGLLTQLRGSGELEYRPGCWEGGLRLWGDRKARSLLSASLWGALVSRGTRIEGEIRLRDLPLEPSQGRIFSKDPMEYFLFCLAWRIRR